MDAEAGEAEVDRQRLIELGAAIVEQVGGVGNRRGDAIADRIDGYWPQEQMAEVEELEAEAAAGGTQQSLVNCSGRGVTVSS